MHDYVYDFAQSVAGFHEVRVLIASEMKNSNASEIRRLQLVLDKEKQDISAILLREKKLRTIFCRYVSFRKLEINCLPLRVMHLASAKQLSVFSCKHLRYVYLTECEIGNIDVSNCELPLLQTLHLSNCSNVHTILKEIESLEMLRHLTLSDSSIHVLPESIFTLINLRTLDISRCGISVLPSTVGFLQKLSSLDISHTQITQLPDSITSICSLRRLEFHHCRSLKALPSNLGALTQLRSLNLEGSGITELPDSVCRIYNLERLKFSFCSELRALPPDFGALEQLRSLNLEGTGITELPETLSSNLWKFESVNIDCLEVLMPYPVTEMERRKRKNAPSGYVVKGERLESLSPKSPLGAGPAPEEPKFTLLSAPVP